MVGKYYREPSNHEKARETPVLTRLGRRDAACRTYTVSLQGCSTQPLWSYLLAQGQGNPQTSAAITPLEEERRSPLQAYRVEMTIVHLPSCHLAAHQGAKLSSFNGTFPSFYIPVILCKIRYFVSIS